MRKKNPTKAPEIPKEVKIASLVNAYELQEHTINPMVYAIGARFDNAEINYEIFGKLTVRKKFRNYKELYSDIRKFSSSVETEELLDVFESLCDRSYLRGSKVDYQQRWRQLRLLNDKNMDFLIKRLDQKMKKRFSQMVGHAGSY